MTIYKLCHWEQNGYNDSDFYDGCWDSETKKFSAILVGSTRFAGGFEGSPNIIPDSMLVEVYQALEVYIRKMLFDTHSYVQENPAIENLNNELKLEVKTACKFQAKQTEVCQKCSGSGKWVNPKNNNDARDCFHCFGKGYKEFKKDKDVKPTWVKVPVGTVFTVKNWKSFGKFYANGYNQPSPSNTTVYGITEDGKHIQVKLLNCRIAGEAPTEESFRSKAHELACAGQFQKATGVKCAWLTTHHAPLPDEFRKASPLELIK